ISDLSCIPISHATAPSLRDTLTMFCREQRIPLHPIHQADNVMGHLTMVADGLGYGLLPAYVSSLMAPNLAVRARGPPNAPTVTIELAGRREAPTEVLEAFIGVVLACFPGAKTLRI